MRKAEIINKALNDEIIRVEELIKQYESLKTDEGELAVFMMREDIKTALSFKDSGNYLGIIEVIKNLEVYQL